MSNINNLFESTAQNCRCDNGIFALLSCLVGKVITIFTESGGESGQGFTGLLVEVTPQLALLITDPSSAFSNRNCCRTNRCQGISAHTVIVVREIVGVTFPSL